MRYFKSLGSDGWKSAVLKIKMRKKLPAITITLTAVSIFCFLVLAEAFFMMTSGSFNALAAQRTASQAEQNARIEVKRLENLDYAELSYLAEHPRQVMDGVEDGNWESEVTLGPEKNLNDDDDVKIRLAHVSIYRTGDSVTRYDVDVPLTSATGTTPIGSVMTWTSEGKPTTGGVWLECNGQTIPSKYKRLRELIGDKTPNYAGVFLRGYGSVTATYGQGSARGIKTSTYSSGPVGEIQGDAMRFFHFHLGNAPSLIGFGYNNNGEYMKTTSNHFTEWHGDGYYRWAREDNPHGDEYDMSGFLRNASRANNFWLMKKPPHKYTLSGGGCSGSGDRGFYCPPPTLNEYDDTDSGEWVFGNVSEWLGMSEWVLPTANEIRPINRAVRYFIKAR